VLAYLAEIATVEEVAGMFRFAVVTLMVRCSRCIANMAVGWESRQPDRKFGADCSNWRIVAVKEPSKGSVV
jgi:hypothetical protein